jgi:hypothetical protein
MTPQSLIDEQNNKAEEVAPIEGAGSRNQESPTRAATQAVALDVKHAVCNYSNFCRVIGTPEEVLLDLGLNENPTVAPTEPVAVTQRVVLNYFTAKRLWHALQITLQRHEAAFGVIETDIQKRLAPRARG